MLRTRAGLFRSLTHLRSIASSAPVRTSKSRLNSASTALASSPSTSYTPPPPLFTPSQDDSLKYHFDSTYNPASHASGGLFMYPPLTSPDALRRLAQRALIHGQHIVDRICRAPSDPTGKELRVVVKNLDRLSDLLCGVIDMCELIRNVHPEQAWVGESEEAYGSLCSFMNELNTHTGLYKALQTTINYDHPQPLSPQEIQVAMTYIRDFERSGIHLPPAVQSRFVQLSDSILSVGRTFLNSAFTPPSAPIQIPDADKLLAGMGAQFIHSLETGPRGSVFVKPGSWEAQMIIRYAREGEARRLVYIGGMKSDPEKIDVLERMLKERSELASVLGKSTWAEVALSDKMAKTPENVMGFLQSLANHHRSSAAADIATLQRIKATSLTGVPYLAPFNAWDKDYYAERYTTPASSLPPITPYFSVGTCLLGLSRLFERLYGISFKPAPIAHGEAWHPSVRRLDVVDESGRIGVIYCDLFSREGKSPSAAHYTVRCSRRVDDDDIPGDALPIGWDASLGPGLETPGEAFGDARYQLPIVVLTTDFGMVEDGKPALLGWNDVETLFHEMGHAIHSMIGRTEWHNVSGTRCATDFVELPSILMEHFASSPEVLSLFASHYQNSEPLPLPLLKAHFNIQHSLSALETHGQIVMALLDQKYHTITDISTFDSTQVYTDLQTQIGVIPPVEGTSWQTQFGHLYGYGATYYSYLFDRAIAGKVWSTLFAKSALDREGGEIFKDRVLKWGGGRDPWEMVGDVVGGKEGEVISRGDQKAMAAVGGWLTK